jgi:superfamily II DNA helicase RecQ
VRQLPQALNAARNGATANTPTSRKRAAPVEPANDLDRFVVANAPFALDLDAELAEASRFNRQRDAAEMYDATAAGATPDGGIRITEPRELNENEMLNARKILACAARMNGRFGKGMLVSTLRGSRSAKLIQFGLDQLTTYGILADLSADEVNAYVEALVTAGALHATGGAYPTLQLTALGGDVMRSRATIQLALPVVVAAFRRRISERNARLSTRAQTDAGHYRRRNIQPLRTRPHHRRNRAAAKPLRADNRKAPRRLHSRRSRLRPRTLRQR